MRLLPDEWTLNIGLSIPPLSISIGGTWKADADAQRHSAKPDKPLRVVLINKASGRCLHVSRDFSDNRLYRGNAHIAPHRHWDLIPHLSGGYTIMSASTCLCLDVIGDRRDDGEAVGQWIQNGKDNQLWYLHELDDHSFNIIVKHSGKALDMPEEQNAAYFDSAAVQWEPHAKDIQRWWLKCIS